jgi:integrase
MTDRESQAIAAWDTSYRRPTKGSSAKIYPYVIDQWFRHFEGADPLDPSREECMKALGRMLPGVLPRTYNQRTSVLRTFFAAMRIAGLTRNGVIEDFRITQPDSKRPTYSEREIERLAAAADAPTRLVVLLCAEAGLRPTQVLRLRWADVSHEHRINVEGTSIPLSQRADAAVHALPRRNGYVLPFRSISNVRRKVRRTCEKAGVAYRGVDVLRRWAP